MQSLNAPVRISGKTAELNVNYSRTLRRAWLVAGFAAQRGRIEMLVTVTLRTTFGE
jgi:hypothetical protein